MMKFNLQSLNSSLTPDQLQINSSSTPSQPHLNPRSTPDQLQLMCLDISDSLASILLKLWIGHIYVYPSLTLGLLQLYFS